jgi:hypothetical protein
MVQTGHPLIEWHLVSLRNRSQGGESSFKGGSFKGGSFKGGSFKGGSFKHMGGSAFKLQAAWEDIKLPWEKKSKGAEEVQVCVGSPVARGKFSTKS